MRVLYEDNHLIAVSKAAGEITQGDKSGDEPLPECVKQYLKEKHNKPGNVYLGVIHRLDRPTSGIVLFAKTSKALSRMNELFRGDKVEKVYHAIVSNPPCDVEGNLCHFLKKNHRHNKSYIVPSGTPRAKEAILHYKVINASDRYTLLEVKPKTGRHHQIRVQLSSIGCPIRGDLKYGARRSLPDASISLHAYSLSFIHPVSREAISIVAPYPEHDHLWQYFAR